MGRDKKLYAEDVNYWKTSASSPDSWHGKTLALIRQFGGEVLADGYGNEHSTGRAAYMIRFQICGEVFRIVWPVLPSEGGEDLAARRQAATMMHHAVKARCVEAQVLGARVAFFAWLELPDGRSACQVANEQLAQDVPRMLLTDQRD